jgi:hypothetical protein
MTQKTNSDKIDDLMAIVQILAQRFFGQAPR